MPERLEGEKGTEKISRYAASILGAVAVAAAAGELGLVEPYAAALGVGALFVVNSEIARLRAQSRTQEPDHQ